MRRFELAVIEDEEEMAQAQPRAQACPAATFPAAALTVAAHVGRGKATERAASGGVGEARHGAHHSLQVLLLFQAARVGLGLSWEK